MDNFHENFKVGASIVRSGANCEKCQQDLLEKCEGFLKTIEFSYVNQGGSPLDDPPGPHEISICYEIP